MEGHVTDVDAITLWTRSRTDSVVSANRELAFEYARRLERAGVTVDVQTWGKTIEARVAPDPPGADRVANAIDSFVRWAEVTGRSLDPFFRERRFDASVLSPARQIRRLPTVAIAEYSGGDLVHVAPSRDGPRTVDVLDRLERLAANTLENHDRFSLAAEDRSTPRSASDDSSSEAASDHPSQEPTVR